ncbi:hypothetical protein C9J44_15970 [Photobacterium sp. GB-27]|uniref:hypothetical protein n=1 Tax=unclassified Photobacterium TaxID=2628852 RepID=UPI000D1683E8|nr:MULTISPECIES: hypothetical protein [unclassified Photobacterium]PSV27365.1 hypothetical protein C9J42_06915 [Photobacterium sp. GB-56]PSV32892.1 hypothetical protein C9J40_00055 [Photobacterium sp. GB-72]PSV34223.1 hypothetical protein C9J44_15970 [Photobacterium sp. GB-27]
MKRNLYAVFVFFGLLSGCSTTLKPTTVGSTTGEFKTNHKISYGGVKLNEDYKEEYSKLVFIKTDEKSKKYNEFFLKSVENTKKFEKVVDVKGMEMIVFEKDLTDKVSSVSDLIGLHNLQKHIGNFLIIEPYVEWKGGYNYVASIKAIDAKSAKEVLHLENSAFNWDGLDQPLFFPLFNGLIQWVEGREINQENKKTKKKS